MVVYCWCAALSMQLLYSTQTVKCELWLPSTGRPSEEQPSAHLCNPIITETGEMKIMMLMAISYYIDLTF